MEALFGFANMSGYMQYLYDMPAQFMEKMTPSVENIPIFIAWLIAYTAGFALYVYAMVVEKRQGVSVYPIWIHCYMMSIDTIGFLTFGYLAITHNFFWFFDLQCVALACWLALEFVSIRKAINREEERNEEFGRLRKGGKISKSDALVYSVAIYVMGFCLNMWGLSLIGGMANMGIWIIYVFTNYVYVIFTWRFWDTRAAQTGKRKFNSVGLQVMIMISTLTCWVPGISWYWAVSPFFHQPWFIILGVAVTTLNLYNLIKVYKLPKWDPKTEQIEA